MTAIITKSNLRKPVFINLSKCSIICYSFVYVTKCLNSVMMRFFIYNPDEIFIYLLLFLMCLHKIPLQKINLKNKWSEVWVSRKEYVDFLNILTLGQTVEYKKALKLVFKKHLNYLWLRCQSLTQDGSDVRCCICIQFFTVEPWD